MSEWMERERERGSEVAIVHQERSTPRLCIIILITRNVACNWEGHLNNLQYKQPNPNKTNNIGLTHSLIHSLLYIVFVSSLSTVGLSVSILTFPDWDLQTDRLFSLSITTQWR